MMNKYIYSTFDEVQLEKEIHGSFAELKAYLDNYVRRLNEENIQNNESHRFHCNNFADAEYICEMCNIQLKAKLVKEPLFTVEDPDWEGDVGDLLYVEAEELIEFANDEVLYTNHPNIRFYKLENAITFLRKYHFNIILHDSYITNDLDEWLETFEDKNDEDQNYLYFQRINEELGFDNKGVMIEEDEYNYYVEINGKYHYYNQLSFSKEDIKNNQPQLRKYILDCYLNVVENIDIDNQFRLVYDSLLTTEKHECSPSKIFKEIEKDKQFMIRQVYVAQKKIIN